MPDETPLVLLPGLLCDAAVWRPVIDLMPAVRATVPTYGMLASIPAMARAVLERVEAERFAVAGHSMGGRVALEILRQAPGRVDRLALLDTGLDPLAKGAAGEAERAKRLALVALAETDGMEALGRRWGRGMVHRAVADTPLFDTIVAMVARHTPEIHRAQIQALIDRPDARDVYASATCPTLLICGRQDAWSPLARHEAMQQLRPSTPLVVIEDAGHMTTMERPAAVARALADWLDAGS